MSSTFGSSGFAAVNQRALTLLLALVTEVALFGNSLELQGQSKGCGNWISGNLRNWQDLDYIPCRIRITGQAFNDRTIKIAFPELNGTKPGFENLLDFTTSGNVSLICAPTVSPPVRGMRTCTLALSYSGAGEGYVKFFARLAVGAHRNPGSSLMLGGEPSSMGELQVHKPGPADEPLAFGDGQRIDRGFLLQNGGFQVEFMSLANRRYCIQYSGDLESWKTAQSLITGNGSWLQWLDQGPPETESHPATQPMRFYRAFLLPSNDDNRTTESGGSKFCQGYSREGDRD